MPTWFYLSSAATFLLWYDASIHRVIDWNLVDWLTIFRHSAVLQLQLKFVLNGVWFSHCHYYVWFKVCLLSVQFMQCRDVWIWWTRCTFMASLIIEWTGYTIQNHTTWKTVNCLMIKLQLSVRIPFLLVKKRRRTLSHMGYTECDFLCISVGLAQFSNYKTEILNQYQVISIDSKFVVLKETYMWSSIWVKDHLKNLDTINFHN